MPGQSKNKGSDAQHQQELEYRRAHAPGGDGRRYSAKREQEESGQFDDAPEKGSRRGNQQHKDQDQGQEVKPDLEYKRAHAPGGDARRYRPTEDPNEQEQDEGQDDEKPEKGSRRGKQQESRGQEGEPDLEYKRAHAPGGDARRYRPTEDEDQGEGDEKRGSSNFQRHQSEQEENEKQQEDDKEIDKQEVHDALSSIGKKAADARWHGQKAEITDEEREAMSKIGRKGGHSSGTGSGGKSQEQVEHDREEADENIEEQDREALSSIGKKAADARWHGEKAQISDEEREAMSKIGRKGGLTTGTAD